MTSNHIPFIFVSLNGQICDANFIYDWSSQFHPYFTGFIDFALYLQAYRFILTVASHYVGIRRSPVLFIQELWLPTFESTAFSTPTAAFKASAIIPFLSVVLLRLLDIEAPSVLAPHHLLDSQQFPLEQLYQILVHQL